MESGLEGWDDKTLYLMTSCPDEGLLRIDAGVRGNEWTLPELVSPRSLPAAAACVTVMKH